MKINLLSTVILSSLLLPLPLLVRADVAGSKGNITATTHQHSRIFGNATSNRTQSQRIAQEDPSNPADTPAEVQKAAQEITVRVTSANNGGSGVLVATKGNTYLVLTNKHVTGRATQFQIQTPDGQKHTARLVPNTGFNSKYDINLLQFTSTQKYRLAILENGSTLSEERAIYSVGYPFDSNQMRISVGKVTQLSDVPLDDGTQIGYAIDPNSKPIKQGMSGGPIVDGRGVLLGINTIGSNPIIPSYTYFDGSKPTAKRAAQYQRANWGVPIYNFLTQLDANILYGYKNFPKVQRQITPEGYLAKLNRETRQQTVRIEDSAGNGSGVIVAKQGNTYYVLTAKHVVETPPRDNKPKQRHTEIKVITHDQESYQIESNQVNVAEGVDMAIVKFTTSATLSTGTSTNYPVAKLGNYNPIGDAIVFAAGYPGRDKIDSPLWQWQLNPGYIQDKEHGKFQTQDKQSFSNGYDLIYSSISYGGMSGGPVFDTEGRVVGIHGKAEGEKRGEKDLIMGQSLGISIQTFLGLKDLLKVPNILNVDISQARNLTQSEQKTVDATLENITQPQAESDGSQWLQYGNQLYRARKYDQATIVFDRAIARNKQYKLLGNYGKALALANAGQFQAASTAINTAILAIAPTERERYYYLWRYQSSIFKELGKYDEALNSINQAIKLEPNDSALRNQQAIIFSAKKQYPEAIKIYDLLISKQPEAYAYYNRGNAKYKLGQKQAAISDYDHAITINPNFTEAYYNRGNAKSELGQKQAAISDYDRAIAINPNYDKAYYNRGNAKSEIGQKQAAISDYDRAIAINPNDAEAYYNRGNAKSKLGQKQAAISDYDRAIAINLNYAEAYYNRGIIKNEIGQNQAAISDYDRAIAINPNFAEAYANRAIIKSELGQKQAAILDLMKAAELFKQQNRLDSYDRAIAILQKMRG